MFHALEHTEHSLLTTKRYLQTVPFARALPLHRHQFHLSRGTRHSLTHPLPLDATLGFALARPPSNCIDTSSCVKNAGNKKARRSGLVKLVCLERRDLIGLLLN